VLPSYCDALTDRSQPVAPASSWPTVMQHDLNTDCALWVTDNIICLMIYWFTIKVVHWSSLISHLRPSETIGVLSHRPIVLTNTVNYRSIGFSHNRPNLLCNLCMTVLPVYNNTCNNNNNNNNNNTWPIYMVLSSYLEHCESSSGPGEWYCYLSVIMLPVYDGATCVGLCYLCLA